MTNNNGDKEPTPPTSQDVVATSCWSRLLLVSCWLVIIFTIGAWDEQGSSSSVISQNGASNSAADNVAATTTAAATDRQLLETCPDGSSADGKVCRGDLGWDAGLFHSNGGDGGVTRRQGAIGAGRGHYVESIDIPTDALSMKLVVTTRERGTQRPTRLYYILDGDEFAAGPGQSGGGQVEGVQFLVGQELQEEGGDDDDDAVTTTTRSATFFFAATDDMRGDTFDYGVRKDDGDSVEIETTMTVLS